MGERVLVVAAVRGPRWVVRVDLGTGRQVSRTEEKLGAYMHPCWSSGPGGLYFLLAREMAEGESDSGGSTGLRGGRAHGFSMAVGMRSVLAIANWDGIGNGGGGHGCI